MTGIETFNVNTDAVLDDWDREDLAQNIYAAAAGRIAMSMNHETAHGDAAFLRTLAAYSRFAAAVYFEAGNDSPQA
jgi:hypothetical protein